MIILLSIMDVFLNILTFGGWGRAQGKEPVALRWHEKDWENRAGSDRAHDGSSYPGKRYRGHLIAKGYQAQGGNATNTHKPPSAKDAGYE
jgi:hypothetical protein